MAEQLQFRYILYSYSEFKAKYFRAIAFINYERLDLRGLQNSAFAKVL